MKGVVNGVTTTYVSSHYELEGVNGTLSYILTDPLGSTNRTINVNGKTLTGEKRYASWGETRYSDGVTPTKKGYTAVQG